jgi:hypothetical protein
MKKKLSYLFLLLGLYCSAQNTFIDSVIKPLEKNQLLFEKVFVHTNKSTYYAGENAWFKAYVTTNENLPSHNTTLLYVNLINANNDTIIDKKNVLISKGVGKGQFQLDYSLKSGKYYIQSYTNNMRNFGFANYSFQEINVLNSESKLTTSTEKKYDIQVLPEGGYLLQNSQNVIGLKALINNRGIDFNGKILNSKNKTIVTFKNQYLGMSKCRFFL